MKKQKSRLKKEIFVAVDIAKKTNVILLEIASNQRKKFRVDNNMQDYEKFADYLKKFNMPVKIGLEPTGNYHRPFAYFLKKQGFKVMFISSFAMAKTRQALHNSWDKNDPKDAQVILHMLKTNVIQVFHDPLIHGINDIQEISKTYYIVSRRKTQVLHSILTHYLPLYFPEAERYFHSARAEWFSKMLYSFPCPASITKLTKARFISKAWPLIGKKESKKAVLEDMYLAAQNSIGLPVSEESDSINMFRVILKEYMGLCESRKYLEEQANNYMKNRQDYKILRSVPGIGPIHALTIVAEAGDLKRFSHERAFLKFCGFDLATQQSGMFRGMSKMSKFGNSRLRCVFWMAATVAVRMRENSLRNKFENYMRKFPEDSDRKRKAYVAVAAKIARIAYSMIKNNSIYRPYYEEAIPSGRICSQRAVEAHM